MDSLEWQNYLDILHKPRRLIWLNFLAGLSRGVGLFLGGGLLGTVVLGLLVWGAAHIIHTVGGLPYFGAKFQELILYIKQIVMSGPSH